MINRSELRKFIELCKTCSRNDIETLNLSTDTTNLQISSDDLSNALKVKKYFDLVHLYDEYNNFNIGRNQKGGNIVTTAVSLATTVGKEVVKDAAGSGVLETVAKDVITELPAFGKLAEGLLEPISKEIGLGEHGVEFLKNISQNEHVQSAIKQYAQNGTVDKHTLFNVATHSANTASEMKETKGGDLKNEKLNMLAGSVDVMNSFKKISDVGFSPEQIANPLNLTPSGFHGDVHYQLPSDISPKVLEEYQRMYPGINILEPKYIAMIRQSEEMNQYIASMQQYTPSPTTEQQYASP